MDVLEGRTPPEEMNSFGPGRNVGPTSSDTFSGMFIAFEAKKGSTSIASTFEDFMMRFCVMP